MKGSYILLLELDESQYISVGRLGILHFAKGFYGYVGSALNGIEARVKRHFGLNKKHHWHIDYLLDWADIYEAILIPGEGRLECTLAWALNEELHCIRCFGSSDCRCPGHLFYTGGRKDLDTRVSKVLIKLGVTFLRYPVPVPKLTLPFPMNRCQ